jgi:hypothetical protein
MATGEREFISPNRVRCPSCECEDYGSNLAFACDSMAVRCFACGHEYTAQKRVSVTFVSPPLHKHGINNAAVVS